MTAVDLPGPVGNQRTRPFPSLLAKLNAPRACVRCSAPGETLPADAFDLGPSGRKRRKVCRECLARQAAEREQFVAAYRATFRDPQTGRLRRRCSTCRKVKNLNRGNFAPKYAHPTRRGERWAYECRLCMRARQPRARRERRARDPERVLAEYRVKGQLYRQRLKQDPGRYERRLERDRTAARLRRIREGRDMQPTADELATVGLTADEFAERRRERRLRLIADGVKVRPPATVQERRDAGLVVPKLPLAPLLAVLEARRVRLGWLVGDACERYDIAERRYSDWLSGKAQRVRADIADRVFCRSDLLWWDVWPEGAPGHEAAAAFFAGRRST